MTKFDTRKVVGLRAMVQIRQEEVAKYLGINRITYSNKERGESEFTATDIARLCDLFNVKADYFFIYVD